MSSVGKMSEILHTTLTYYQRPRYNIRLSIVIVDKLQQRSLPNVVDVICNSQNLSYFFERQIKNAPYAIFNTNIRLASMKVPMLQIGGRTLMRPNLTKRNIDFLP